MHLPRVTVDTTVQPKAVTHPTDSKLLHRGIEVLACREERSGIENAFLQLTGSEDDAAR